MKKNLEIGVVSFLILVGLVASFGVDDPKAPRDEAQMVAVEPTPAPAPTVVERHVTPPTVAMIDGVTVEFEGDAVIYR